MIIKDLTFSPKFSKIAGILEPDVLRSHLLPETIPAPEIVGEVEKQKQKLGIMYKNKLLY